MQDKTPHIDVNGPRQRLEVTAAGRTWLIERTADLETLWESIGEDDFGQDERLPYWAELWPSSVVLANWLAQNRERIAGRVGVDMGCGLGLTALVGALYGARVLAFDYEYEPLVFAHGNAPLNGVSQPLWVQMDWRSAACAAGAADFIWAGDIIYEKRFIGAVTDFLDHTLAADGVAWIAEPGRAVAKPFERAVRELGWSFRRVVTETMQWEGHPVTVHILEITKNA
ncbi:methyltransferase domain-containing protein [Desulfobaculum senezii]|jgi:predicted nicotinamide N-methyase|uniref:class I SAM-dependent methyltransferase n=1 Tax=Desulfobaculum sp. SPO524 TaxID=3378071 RepID=UPI003852C755